MTSFSITLDGRAVDVTPGQTVLEAARKLGLDIPTLCYLERCGPLTSCLACVVKVDRNGAGRLVPACATRVQPGMRIESETSEVRDARRTALELLLSDHVGDCLSPCHRICPLGLNVPRMIRQVQAQRLDEAVRTLREAIALPAVLGRLCHHPCENGCRRGVCDSPTAIRDLERYVADTALRREPPSPEGTGFPRELRQEGHLFPKNRPGPDASSPRSTPPLPAAERASACPPSSGKSVAIVGAGPTGLTAAYHLLRDGHACTLFDRQAEPGGSLRAVDQTTLPRAVLEAETGLIASLGAQFKTATVLGRDVSLGDLERRFDAVLLAPGQLARDEIQALGLESTGTGIRIDVRTFQARAPKVFAAGSALKPIKQLIRAMSDGQEAARCLHEFLSRGEIRPATKPFSSVMGRLEREEIERVRSCGSPAARVEPAGGVEAGLTDAEAVREAQRCLHCDCRAAGDCKLQYYAERYGADPGRFSRQRRLFEQQARHAEVIFEPGKCILCGICVALTRQAGEPLGLTFVERGFDVRVAAPLDRPFADGLRQAAADCVKNCPTGALAFKESSPAGRGGEA
ncbi:MAG: (2Fe-2S)-binding protein [Verrucomicrobia bacterium]|nr:(2Fe-2S)-binding protein [Verrucomicrobiota bacterium]